MTDGSPVLSDADRAFFRANGYLILDDGMPRELALRWTRESLAYRGIDCDDRTTWPNSGWCPLNTISPSRRIADLRDFAPKAWQAICELVGGEERINTPALMNEDLVMNFGSDDSPPWQDPATSRGGWHTDGDFNHFIDSPEAGLFIIFLFSDVSERGGATWIAPDSIGPIAGTLLEHPQGLSACVLNRDHNQYGKCRRFMPVSGPAGRVYLMHPLMLHSSSINAERRLRAIRNYLVSMRQPMNFDPAARPLSEVERCTLQALGVDRLDFTPPPDAWRHPTNHDTGAATPKNPPFSPEKARTLINIDIADYMRAQPA